MENFHFFSLNLKLNLGPRASKASALNCIPGPIFHPSRTIYKKRSKINLLLKDQLSKDSRSIKRASGTLIQSDSTANCPSVTEGDSCHREIAPSIRHRPRDSERGWYQVRPALLLAPCPSLAQSTAFPCPPLQRNIDLFFPSEFSIILKNMIL